MTSVRDFATQIGLNNPPISVRSLLEQFATDSLRSAIAVPAQMKYIETPTT
jgi:hypothetical protein